jgi:hypothetical protein
MVRYVVYFDCVVCGFLDCLLFSYLVVSEKDDGHSDEGPKDKAPKKIM